ncbi:hypothetical protein RND71_021220 [Anisodus tanguticus]|uniref:Pentatricopeptide repeat-containing protein n=1 Tax=Anisodus tanguticus TaxID=243964 RepID=A0AAE1VCL7_9SOLA|nr:hypothetical protein RND71_021220 [Anisodus tanguticus]
MPMIATYSRCNRVGDSFKVFNGMKERDIVSWNTMVSALVQNGLDNEALMLVYEMQKLGVSIDDITITILLSAASNFRDREIGQFKQPLYLFNELRISGLLYPDNYTYPYVFKATGELNMVKEGEKIHAYVSKFGVWFDKYVGNSVMDMYGLFGCGRYDDGVMVYKKMREESDVKPDEATVVSTLSACTALKKLELGKEIHRYIVEEVGFRVIIGNALVDMYCKCGCLMVARQIFDDMPMKNVICWTSMVSGYVNSGQLDEARELFERSPIRDLVLWTTMINGYVQFNRVDDAMDLFRSMQMQRIKPDKYTLVALLTGCAQVGALQQGEWIHDYMKENGIAVTAVVGTALIEMYA